MIGSDSESPNRLDNSGVRLDYNSAVERVMSLANFERSNDSYRHSEFHLERISRLLDCLGNPHLRVPTVHVAGSKGKGSTSAMVASILGVSGYKVGMYTSPHLHSVVERIRVGGKPIERGEFASLVELILSSEELSIDEVSGSGLTFFEALTAMAFAHFDQIDADFQVIEVGLGGRLDATNVVNPEVSVITRISLDHVSVLGDSIELISAEKAGIIKSGIPVVVSPQPQNAMHVFSEIAIQKGARIVQVGQDVVWRKVEANLDGQIFDVDGVRNSYRLWMPLIGDHQIQNAATAVAAVEALTERGFHVPAESVIEGFRRVNWPGRFQVLSLNGVRVVVDCAHNPESMQLLMDTLRDNLEFRRLIVVFGSTGGHSVSGMTDALKSLSPRVVAVRSRHPKSVPPQIISMEARRCGLRVVLESDDVGDGVKRAVELLGEEDLVLGTGSLSVVAEVIEEIETIAPEIYENLKRPLHIAI